MNISNKIGLGGGCHWCTEGVFASLKGITKIEQGWISASDEPTRFSEAIIVHYQPETIELKDLLDIHVQTHASTSSHSMREKYRSAIYTFCDAQVLDVKGILDSMRERFEVELIIRLLDFHTFKRNIDSLHDYFYTRPNAPFCKKYIVPKLELLNQHYRDHLNVEKINSAGLNLNN